MKKLIEAKELDRQIEPLRREFDEIVAFLQGCGRNMEVVHEK